MAEVLPSPRRRASRPLVAFLAVLLVAGVGVGAASLLSEDETRRLCDAAVSDGVTTAAAATTIAAAADDVLHDERRARADHARAHGDVLTKRVVERREQVLDTAWVPRCTSRGDVETVRAQTRATERSADALHHAVMALRAAHPDRSR